ncbi:MAG: hypothetical protein E2598_06060 [Sphingobium sp.]|nr:hypothetical protein [Sphingobium sp.]
MSGIVCLGWGSLVWDARDLPIEGGWNSDGPGLPLEFARQSGDDRMTLVIVNIEHHVPTLWAEMNVNSLAHAINALAAREGVQNPNAIGRWPNTTDRQYPLGQSIAEWAGRMGFSGVVWTALQPGMKETRGTVPTLDELTAYIAKLDNDTRLRAKAYIDNAPVQIATPYREVLARACEASWKEPS